MKRSTPDFPGAESMVYELEQGVSLLSKMLREARHTVFFGGAGVSTDSGLADFRSRERGVYNQPNPYGCSTDRILSPEFYNQHPAEFFDFYRTRLLDLSARPNKVHYILADMERRGALAAIITQNADNLHQRAGSKNVIDIHGNVYDNTCPDCGRKFPPEAVAECESIPRCPCGGIIRPGIILFGEVPDMGLVMKAVRQLRLADLLLIGGTSLKVSSASRLLAGFKGNMVIINDESTPFDGRAELVLREKISEVFERLWPIDRA